VPRRKKLGDTQPASQPESSLSSFPAPPAGSDQGAGDPPAGPAIGEAQVGSAQLGGPRVLLSYNKPLPHVLTPEELRQRALDLTATFHEIDAEDAFQKRTKDTLKSRMSGLINKQRELSQVVETGKEDRPVDVDDILVGNFVETTRRDTGEVLSRRDPTKAELQGVMPLEKILEQDPEADPVNDATPEE
jgi:hypothetical protein